MAAAAFRPKPFPKRLGLQHRPGNGCKQEENHRNPARKQNELFDANPAAVTLDRQLQVRHRRPFDLAESPAIEQVNNHRDRCEQHPPEQRRIVKGKTHHSCKVADRPNSYLFTCIERALACRNKLSEFARSSFVRSRIWSMLRRPHCLFTSSMKSSIAFW